MEITGDYIDKVFSITDHLLLERIETAEFCRVSKIFLSRFLLFDEGYIFEKFPYINNEKLEEKYIWDIEWKLEFSREFIDSLRKGLLNKPVKIVPDNLWEKALLLAVFFLNPEFKKGKFPSINMLYYLNRGYRKDFLIDDVMEEGTLLLLFKKNISNGFEYVLDANGNVMKDTAGNDIKIQKFKEITCTLIETRQFKSVEIRGEVEILSLKPERLIQKEPFGASNQFEHFSARSIGDEGALTEEALKMTQQEKIPFPSDVDMVLLCTETIKPAIRNAIYANRNTIR